MRSLTARNPGVPSPFPRQKKVTLRYSDSFYVPITTGTPAWQVYRCNSCFDPDVTNAGHQPYLFDQFCAAAGPYANYTVTGFRATLEGCHLTDADDNYGATVVAGFSTTSSAPPRAASVGNNLAQLVENPGWKAMLLNAASGPRKMAFQATTSKYFGVPDKSVLSEDSYSAAYNANPTDQYYFQVGVCSTDLTQSCYINLMYNIEYDVVFKHPTSVTSAS